MYTNMQSACSKHLEEYVKIKLGLKKVPAANGTKEQYKGLNLQLIRLGSYRGFPVSCQMPPHRLARAGHYYLGTADETECFCCKKRVRNWHKHDRPMEKHQPNCLYLRDHNSVNVPLPGCSDTDERGGIRSAPLPQRIEDDSSQSFHNSAPLRHDVPLADADPSYITEQARMRTFDRWPSTAFVSAEELVQAGFIYFGSGDRVQCVFCKGILRNWEAGDQAFSVHQQNYPQCPFVLNPLHYTIPASAKEDDDRVVDPREVTARMDTPAVKTVLGLGFDKTFVRNVIHYRLAKEGDDFETPAALTETVHNFLENAPRDFPLKKASNGSGGRAPASGTNSAGGAKKKKKKKDKKKRSAADIAGAINSTGSASEENTQEEPVYVAKHFKIDSRSIENDCDVEPCSSGYGSDLSGGPSEVEDN